MKVKALMAQLKKMPQGLEVGFSNHDNSEHEIADWVHDVVLFDKDEIPAPDYIDSNDRDWYDSQPKRAVVLRS